MLDSKWKEPRYGYTPVFTERGEPGFMVNRQDECVGDSYTVVDCPSEEAAKSAHRLLTLKVGV